MKGENIQTACKVLVAIAVTAKCDHPCRVQNKEWKVHGQMAEYFNKCLAIYKSIWPFYIILWIWCTKY